METPFRSDKILRHPERIAEWMRSGWTTCPVMVDMDLTNRCNHNCPKCVGNGRQDPTAQLATEEAIDYLKQFRAMGARSVGFAGAGEPCMHPDLGKIVEAAAGMGLKVSCITNGTLMTEELATILRRYCTWIRVSLGGATPKTMERTHGVPESAFSDTVVGISRLAQAEGDAVLGIGFLTEDFLADEIVRAADLAKYLGAAYIQFHPYNDSTFDATEKIKQAVAIHDDDTFKVFGYWTKYREMREGYVKPYPTCHFQHFATVVSATAEMCVCCDHREDSGRWGSLRDHTAKELWTHSARKSVCEVDLATCPALCRGNVHNIALDAIARPLLHEEFV